MRRHLKTYGLLLCGIVLLLGLSTLVWAKMEMSMTSVYMNTHPTVVNAWEPWFKEMAKLTDGDIQIAYYNPNTLTPLNDHYDGTISGLISIGANDTSRNAGKFPLSTVMELPGLAPGAECGSLVFWELYKKYPELQKEFDEVKILWLWSSATYQLHTTKKQIKTMDDLKGLKIIAWNRTSVEILNSLGANPIQMPPTDSYLALERGMADGVLCPLAPIVSFKISDAAKYTTICDIFLNGFWAGMSHDLYNSLPPKDKEAFDKTTGAVMARESGLTLDQGAVSDAEKLTAKGHTFYVMPQAERQRMIDATISMRDTWLKEMEAKGYKNAKAIMDDAFALGAKYAGETGRGFKE